MNMDQAILQAFPLLAASASGNSLPAACDGVRYVVARNGVWREISLPWIRVRHQVANAAMDLPYGKLVDCVEYLCGPVPREVIRQFIEEAREAAPTEIAAAFIWNQETGQWRYGRREAISASADHINYREVALEDVEHLVIDVHSHGHGKAFFSADDDRDDFGTMRVSLVVGNVDQERPSSAMRLCMAGHVRLTTLDATGALKDHG